MTATEMVIAKVIRIQRRNEILQMVGMSKTTLRNRINDGLMPPSISLGDRARGWILEETQAVLRAMVAGQSKEQIRALVCQLVEQRQQAAV